MVKLTSGGSMHDPSDPVGRLLFTVLAMVGEVDLIRIRSREGMRIAKPKGRLHGRAPQLNPHHDVPAGDRPAGPQ